MNRNELWFVELAYNLRYQFIQMMQHLSRSTALQILALRFLFIWPAALNLEVQQTELNGVRRHFRPQMVTRLLAELPKLSLFTVAMCSYEDWKHPQGWHALDTTVMELAKAARDLVPEPRGVASELYGLKDDTEFFWHYFVTSAAHSRARRMRGKDPRGDWST